MPEITKRETFYADRGRVKGVKTMHVETDGAVVNITVGLTGPGGRRVTRVDVLPDGPLRGGDGEGRVWVQPTGDARIIRLHEGEKSLPVNDQSAPSSGSGAGDPSGIEMMRTLADEVRARVAAGVTPGSEAADDLSAQAWMVNLQVPRGVALRLLIDPAAPLAIETATPNLHRISIKDGE